MSWEDQLAAEVAGSEAAGFARVAADILRERQRQNVKFPDQRFPDVYLGPAASLPPEARAGVVAQMHRLPTEAQARRNYDCAVSTGTVSWLDVLVEEVAELVMPAATGDLEHLRAELVQVAAVAARQIEDIDRRRAGR